MAIPIGLGLALITARSWRRPCFGLAVAYWGATLAIGLTVSPDTNRFVIAAPIYAIACGLALDAVARIAIELLRLDRHLVHGALAVAVALLVGWNVNFYFRDHQQLLLYGDANTLLANELARHLEDKEPGTLVYFAGPHECGTTAFPTWHSSLGTCGGSPSSSLGMRRRLSRGPMDRPFSCSCRNGSAKRTKYDHGFPTVQRATFTSTPGNYCSPSMRSRPEPSTPLQGAGLPSGICRSPR